MSQEPNEISLCNRANLNQSKLSKMHCIRYGASEHETRSGLCFEAKQIQFAPEFHHIMSRKKVLLRTQNNILEKLGTEKQVRIIEKSG